MATVLAFDVNETLLDLHALDPLFDDVLGDAALRPQWFATMLQLSFVGGLTGQYVDFSTAQRAALKMTAARARKDLSTAAIETVVDAMRRLPAHPEVPQALTRLADAGYRVTALTNSVLDVARAQLSNAGLIEPFEAVFSADEVRALKPSAAPYRMVADQLRCRHRRGVPGRGARLGCLRGVGRRRTGGVRRPGRGHAQSAWRPTRRDRRRSDRSGRCAAGARAATGRCEWRQSAASCLACLTVGCLLSGCSSRPPTYPGPATSAAGPISVGATACAVVSWEH